MYLVFIPNVSTCTCSVQPPMDGVVYTYPRRSDEFPRLHDFRSSPFLLELTLCSKLHLQWRRRSRWRCHQRYRKQRDRAARGAGSFPRPGTHLGQVLLPIQRRRPLGTVSAIWCRTTVLITIWVADVRCPAVRSRRTADGTAHPPLPPAGETKARPLR